MENERRAKMSDMEIRRGMHAEDDEMEISLVDIFKALKRGWYWMVIAPVLVGLLVGFYALNYRVDEYEAQVKLYTLFDYVDSTGTTRYDTNLSNYFINDYKEMIKAPEVMQETCRRLGWAQWPDGMNVSVSPVTGTRFISIGVRSTNPQMCMDAANMLAQVFSEYARNMVGSDSVRLATEASLPTAPVSMSNVKLVGLAVAAAFVAAAGVLVVLQLLNTKVCSGSDANVRFRTNVLSNIYGYKKEMDAFLKHHKAKDSDILSCMNEHTQESIKKLALNLEFAAVGTPLRMLTVTSTTPKEGKSSVSLMLACELANQGKRVLVADMDYRSPMIGRYLGKRNKKDILDYMNGASLAEVIADTNVPNLYFMDNRHGMAVNVNQEAFARFQEECKKHFDLVIFDTPPLGMFVDAALLATKSDGALVVVADEQVDRKDLMKVFVQLDQVKANVLGMAFNQVSYKSSGHYYYNYYRYYHYGEHHKRSRREESEA